MISSTQKLIWFNAGLVHYKTKLIYTGKKRKKKKSLNVSYPKRFNGRGSVAILFEYYLLFYPKFRKKHTNITYIERVVLHGKKKKKKGKRKTL